MESLNGLYKHNFFQGLGIGQFVFMMQQFFDEQLFIWQLQPIHNVFLLIFSELGVIGLSLFLWFFTYSILKNNQNVPRGTIELVPDKCSTWNNSQSGSIKLFHVEHFVDKQLIIDKNGIVALTLRSVLVVIITIMLFDHYLWDIQQGQLLLWIVLSLAVSRRVY